MNRQLRTRRDQHAATGVRMQVAALNEARTDRLGSAAEIAAFLRDAARGQEGQR